MTARILKFDKNHRLALSAVTLSAVNRVIRFDVVIPGFTSERIMAVTGMDFTTSKGFDVQLDYSHTSGICAFVSAAEERAPDDKLGELAEHLKETLDNIINAHLR